MRQTNYFGFNLKSHVILLLIVTLFVSSCEQKEDKIAPDQNANGTLEKHFQFLEQSTGFDKKDIAYDKVNKRFLIDNDIYISKSTVEEYMLKKEDTRANERTEQRRYTYLVSDAYVNNVKYYIQPSVPWVWRTAISQAISQWNNVGGSKLRCSEVSGSGEANVNVDVQYDNVNNWVARAYLPYSNGAPGGGLTVNSYHDGMDAGQKLFAMVHEIGHNIGLLHTNQTDGAIIPGTPETDANSVMNSFVLPWSGFTEYDRVAVRNLYPGTFSQIIQAEGYSSMSGIQLENTSDAGGGQNVGWIEAGDWMAYNSINIPSTGSYLIEYRVASTIGSRLSLDVNAGTTVLGMLDIPNTGGWQNWTTISHIVNINAGTYNFGIYAQAGGWNINWWRITKR